MFPSGSDGTAADPVHNLGYLESTAACPGRHAPTFEARNLIRPDLRIMDGDIVTIDFYAGACSATIFGHPIEIFDPGKKALPSHLQLEANPIFHNTEAGALPSTIERVSNYTPLNTSMFDGVLSSSDNNLQAAVDTLDNHQHKTVNVIPSVQNPNLVVGPGATVILMPFASGNHTGWNAAIPRAASFTDPTRCVAWAPGGVLYFSVKKDATGNSLGIVSAIAELEFSTS